MRLDGTTIIPAPIDDVWALVTDIPVVGPCMPGMEEMQEIESGVFGWRHRTRMGPISVAFAGRLTVNKIEPETYTAELVAMGKDNRVGSSVHAKLKMRLAFAGSAATMLCSAVDADVSGRVGELGHWIIKRKFTSMMEEFSACIGSRLANGGGGNGA